MLRASAMSCHASRVHTSAAHYALSRCHMRAAHGCMHDHALGPNRCSPSSARRAACQGSVHPDGRCSWATAQYSGQEHEHCQEAGTCCAHGHMGSTHTSAQMHMQVCIFFACAHGAHGAHGWAASMAVCASCRGKVCMDLGAGIRDASAKCTCTLPGHVCAPTCYVRGLCCMPAHQPPATEARFPLSVSLVCHFSATHAGG